ncbi:MAG: hypothetical protein DRI84_07680 [Bacteroidetes bacterium]|nr:MAG: hypothetical protein DRI84_07680 [Bacteroidota bacterium]
MMQRVLSLDIATTTGWAFNFVQTIDKFEYGLIKTNPKHSEGKRLAYFRKELIKLISKFNPTHVVIEDIYSGINVKTLKLLAKYAGVAQECCVSFANIDPYIIHTSTVKAYFKAKNKRQLFDFAVTLLNWDTNVINFKNHNDIVDSICQLICYCDKVLGVKKYREEKDYGYLYKL